MKDGEAWWLMEYEPGALAAAWLALCDVLRESNDLAMMVDLDRILLLLRCGFVVARR